MKMQQSKGPSVPIVPGKQPSLEPVECLEPSMQEIATIKEELEREMKLDKIFVQKQQQIKIEEKHKRRQEYMNKNIQEKKKIFEEIHRNYVA